jgi:hypothetical protein
MSDTKEIWKKRVASWRASGKTAERVERVARVQGRRFGRGDRFVVHDLDHRGGGRRRRDRGGSGMAERAGEEELDTDVCPRGGRRPARSELRDTADVIRRALWLSIIVCGCSTRSADPAMAVAFVARPGDIAITDVSVVPMSSDGALAHHTVVIRGDRIAALAARASVPLPSGVTVIDGAGKWLIRALRTCTSTPGTRTTSCCSSPPV